MENLFARTTNSLVIPSGREGSWSSVRVVKTSIRIYSSVEVSHTRCLNLIPRLRSERQAWVIPSECEGTRSSARAVKTSIRIYSSVEVFSYVLPQPGSSPSLGTTGLGHPERTRGIMIICASGQKSEYSDFSAEH